MSGADVKSILGLPGRAAGEEGARPAKVREPKPERPKGVSREAYALLYGGHPIAPSALLQEITKVKEQAKAEEAKTAKPSLGPVRGGGSRGEALGIARALLTCALLSAQSACGRRLQ